MHESKQEVTKVVFLVNMAENLPDISSPFIILQTSLQLGNVHGRVV